MNGEWVKNAIESILFVAGDAVELSALAAALDIDENELDEIVEEMINNRRKSDTGILLRKVESKIQFCTNPQYSQLIEKTLQTVKKSRLSQSLLETLSIIAYKQPVTRFDIEQVRGVSCSYSLAMLIEKGLVERAGTKKTLGNPLLYKTNDEFLRHFGISAINELPALKKAE